MAINKHPNAVPNQKDETKYTKALWIKKSKVTMTRYAISFFVTYGIG